MPTVEYQSASSAARAALEMRVLLQHFLTAQELADYVGVPLSTVYRWRRVNSGPVGVRIGKHLRFRISDVETWVEQSVRQNSHQ